MDESFHVAARRELEVRLAGEASPVRSPETSTFVEVRGTARLKDEESLIGQCIGPYRILSELGAGGMGEVYAAKDTRLERDVAIKILPEQFLANPDRRMRFVREARLLAALNHPNIAQIHQLEEDAGIQALVMELVPGETLAGMIASAPRGLTLNHVLAFARQIANALEAAHEKGIVHRDLKPSNIKVTPDGTVKVLDFGLAKAMTDDSSDSGLRARPTLLEGTNVDAVLGTSAYMSPEQTRGQPVDKRTDIWAFGCVLFEMLTGRRAFSGSSASETAAAILEREPQWDRVSQSISPRLQQLVRRCLEKDAKSRLRDIGDARIELGEIESNAADMTSRAAPASSARRAGVVWWGLGSVALAAATGVLTWYLKPTTSQAVTRTAISLPAGQQFPPDEGTAGWPDLAVSPDGSVLAYVATTVDGARQLYLRPMDRSEVTAVPDTNGAVGPFFSPDGQWLGFFAGGELKKAPVSGGIPASLAGVLDSRGAAWSRTGTIVFPVAPLKQGLSAISDRGGAVKPLTQLRTAEANHRWPEFLPDGKAVLFVDGLPGNWINAKIVAQWIGTDDRRDVVERGTQPRYARSGHLVYARDGVLMAAPFDRQRLQISGTPVPMVEGVRQGDNGEAQYSLSDSGTLVYITGHLEDPARQLVWVDRHGAEQLLPTPTRNYLCPRISPDGRRVAVGIEEQNKHIWVASVSTGTLTPLTSGGNYNRVPAWTPDGQRIAFSSNRGGQLGLFWQPADGSAGADRLKTAALMWPYDKSWSPDGRLIAFTNVADNGKLDIWVQRISDGHAQLVLGTAANEREPRFSPDGGWLAYSSDKSGRLEVYVRPYPGPGGDTPISTDGGMEPVWNPSKRDRLELFYRNGRKMMVVDIVTQPTLAPGKPRLLFEGHYNGSFDSANYDVAPDGQRFLMLKPMDAPAMTQINVVQNWFEELTRRVPNRSW
jgi:serine/threonine-protein kinase